MIDITKLTAEELMRGKTAKNGYEWFSAETFEEILRRLARLEKCEAALLKARMLLISEGDPDEDSEMIAEIDELLGKAARAALEGK